jgi:putative DNA primase/helicase
VQGVTCGDFLAPLHRGGDHAYLWQLPSKRSSWFRVGEPLPALPATGDVYFGVHPTTRGGSASQRATNDTVSVVNCLFAEFDVGTSNRRGEFATKERALDHIRSQHRPPSAVVDSGGGFHCYWLLDETFVIGTGGDRERVAAKQAAWVEAVAGDPGAKDLARVLRLPGTLNTKYDPPRPVQLTQENWERSYSLEELETSVAPPVSEASVTRIAPRAAGDDDLLARARNATNGGKFRALYDDGDLSAYGDDRSAADLALCSMLAFWTKGDAAATERLFGQSALVREKWTQRPDYRDRTIQKALSGADGRPDAEMSTSDRHAPPRNPAAGYAELLAPLTDLDTNATLVDIEERLTTVATSATGAEFAREMLREHLIAGLKHFDEVSSPAKLADMCLHMASPDNHDDDPSRQGTAVLFDTPDPWEHSVVGSELLSDLVETVQRFAAIRDAEATAVSLWIVHTYALPACEITPRLAITSPTKRCGKTTLRNVVAALAHRPLSASNASAAAVFRAIEAYRPTLLLDEADTFIGGKDELRGILNAGHSRFDAHVLRCDGDDHEPRVFDVFAPVAVVMIGALPDTLADRSIEVAMERKGKGVTVERWRADRQAAFIPLRRRCVRWVNDHADVMRELDPSVPPSLGDREADNWRALLAVADAVGEGWPERARAAALSLSGHADKEDADRRTQVLDDIRTVFDTQSKQRIRSAELVAALVEMEERQYGEWRNGDALTKNGLARTLKPFRIRPKQIRFAGSEQTQRGYERDMFVEAWSRYVAAPGGQSEQAEHSSDDAPPTRSEARNTTAHVPDGHGDGNPHDDSDVPGVPVADPPPYAHAREPSVSHSSAGQLAPAAQPDGRVGPGYVARVSHLGDEQRNCDGEALTERAAIMEYDGGLSRGEAETRAGEVVAVFDGPGDLSGSVLLDAASEATSTAASRESTLVGVQFLRTTLANGGLHQDEVERLARDAGIDPTVLSHARHDAGVTSDGRLWSLPPRSDGGVA